ncbi:MAG: DNA gyrase subunit A [Parcubacteria group bacterium]|nr:DNA gyrase subunit A [Parcubacteria group bacterium]
MANEIAPSPELGKIKNTPITEEMSRSYLDYAMSVIVARALPDVRDGLKPVHRRILFAMHELGITPQAKTRKSAAIVGDVIAKYHPHGDVAVYDALVRMAQDFTMRYPLVVGQGNFGSIDNDPPAAMRYTEAKMAAVTSKLLSDIEKETVEFTPTYDGTRKEPLVLPADFPNLLVNGSIGIAVGMATAIPTHNLAEIVDGLVLLIDTPESTVEDLMEYIKGPDFPTGGIIFDRSEIMQAYATGRGSIVVRGRADIIEAKHGNYDIIITEIPYQLSKALLLEKIAEMVTTKRIEGVRDVRDESDKEGIRIVVELKKDAYPKNVLNQLYKFTPLETSFHVNLLALVGGIEPTTLTLKTALAEFLKHRFTIVEKRSRFDLVRAEERLHILEGFKKALGEIDAVIQTIKRAHDRSDAKVKLMAKFAFSDRQAEAILDLRLSQLAALERQKIEDEYQEKVRLIASLKELLSHPKKMWEVIRKELIALKATYADERRTTIVPQPVGEFKEEDLIPDYSTVIVRTESGYVKRIRPELFKTQHRGGKGLTGMVTKEMDAVVEVVATSTHAELLLFTNRGRVFRLKAYEIPEGSRVAKGKAMVNFLELASEEYVTALVPSTSKGMKYLVMATRLGVVKKTALSDFASVRRSGLIAIRLGEGDLLRWVMPVSGDHEILLSSKHGKTIRFSERDIRGMGRQASGVRGMKLAKGDELIDMEVIERSIPQLELLVVTKAGLGKRTKLASFRKQHRGGKGLKLLSTTVRTGTAVTTMLLSESQRNTMDLLLISARGQTIRIPVRSISLLGRQAQGVRIMRLSEGDSVASATLLTNENQER